MGSPPFDIGYGGAEPLDMSNLGPAQPQQQASQPLDPEQRKSWLRLAMILPLAMKGGPGAMEGFLGGLNQAEQQRQVQQRQTAQDQQRKQQIDAETKARQDTITGQRDTRVQQLLKDYMERLSAATSPEEAQAIKQLYGLQAQSLGMRPGALEPYAASLTPDTFTARKIQKTWASLPAESKSEALKNGWTLNVGDQQVPFEQWSAVVGGVVDPATGKPPVPKPAQTDKRGFTPKDITLNGQRITANYDPDTGQYFAIGNNETPLSGTILEYQRPPAPTGDNKPLTPNQRANIISSRRNQWTRFSKAVTDRQGAIQKVDSGVQALARGNRNAATQAIIIGFNKLLDETSVVREGEYARTEQLVPLVNRIEGAINRITMGGASMTDADLRALATEAKNIAQSLEGISQEAAANLRQGIEEELGDYGIPSSRVFGGSTIGVRQRPATSSGTQPSALPNAADPLGIL
jgi:hypothetical protein